MSTSHNQGRIFPVDSSLKNPHDTLCQATMGFFDYFGTVGRLESAFSSVLNRQGHGFANLGGIASTYEAHWMDAEGIEPFPNNERYVVGFEDRTGIQWIMYSKPEIQGWLALLAYQIAYQKNPDWIEPLKTYLSKQFQSDHRLALLRDKLSDNLSWDFGPVGIRAGSAAIEEWKSQHCQELADVYFENI